MGTKLADHLTGLGGEFALWRSFCVRGAGLPYDWLETGGDGETGVGRRTDDGQDPGSLTYQERSAAADRAAYQIAAQPLFTEAIQWQNPLVAAQLRRAGELSPKRRRQLTRTLWAYASRYCAKNDSIGFFGFKAWGTWTAGETSLGAFEPVPRGPVYLELWAARLIAEALQERHGLWPWTVPQVAPSVALTGDRARMMDGSALRMTAGEREVAAACDGFRTVTDVVAECAAGDRPQELVTADIRRLAAMGVLTAGFAVHQSRHPERQLRMQLHRVADPARRDAALNDLDDLTTSLEKVTAALGSPAAQQDALQQLDETFTRLTAAPAQRRPGEYYAGRSIAFEDCVGERDTLLGPAVLTDIAPALELLLLSARWFSVQVAAGYAAWAAELLAQAPPAGPEGYPLGPLLGQLSETFYDRVGDPGGPASAAAAELRRRWTAILRRGAGPGCWSVTADEIRALAASEFAAPGPGWPGARWHSPDLMIAAASPGDIAAGRYLAVLGEMHPTINTLDSLSFLSAHPDERAVRSWIDADVPARIVPLYPSEFGINSRTSPPEGYHSPGSVYLGIGTEPSYHPRRATLLPGAALTVHERGGRLVVRSPSGDFEAELAEVLGDYLALAAHNRFGLLERRPHQPRTLIDRLVVARESWRIPYGELPAGDRAREDLFRQARDLRAERGIQRRVFARIAGEVKPVYVDFANPFLVDVLWSKLRRGRERVPDGDVVFSEMLPGPGDLWLRDAEGRRYTAEFRAVCVDRRSYAAGREPAGRPGSGGPHDTA
jgi:lantibiotic biosynthesis dehydratase-like protein